MPHHAKHAGVWKQSTPYAKHAGVWKPATVYAKQAGAWKLVHSPVVVTLSGENVTHQIAGTATAGIRVNTDGTIDKREGSTYTQIDSGTDWIIPNGDADSTYDFRVTSVTGHAFDNSPGADGTWFPMSSNREWNIVRSFSGQWDTTFTLEVRKDSGATIDTAPFSLTADNII